MDPRTRKRLILIGIAILVVAALVYAFWPDARVVGTAVVERGPLRVTVEEEGETQVAETYELSSPVPAYARRIELEPGDPVDQGQAVVLLEPPRSAIMDPRAEAQAQAGVAAAQAGLAQSRQNVESAESAAAEAREEHDRIAELFGEGSATQQQLTRAQTAAEQAEASLEAARAAVEAAEAELASARAAAGRATGGSAHLTVTDVLTSPVSGQILAVHRESAGQVQPGEPLVEIGNVNDLEIQVDVLSQDAVRIAPGTSVVIEEWGGEGTLEATVRRIDPRGYTRVSSLGVEEKRVPVVATFNSTASEWTRLGAGYRVLARFILFEGDQLLIVPTSALFRTDAGWAVFAVEGGRAVQRSVDVGWQSGLQAEVVSGLEEGEEVVIHPPNDLADGDRVRARGD